MNRYRYHARDAGGESLSGDVIALDIDEAGQILQSLGVFITSLRLESSRRRRLFRNPWVFMSALERQVLLRSWMTLLNSGFSMQSALSELRRNTRNKTAQKAILEAQQCLDRGFSLGQSLRSSRLLPCSWVSLIENTESRGDYVSALEVLLKHTTQIWRIKREFISILTVPCMILIVGVIGLWIYLERVAPAVVEGVSGVGGTVPTAEALAGNSSGILSLTLGFLLALFILALVTLRSSRSDQTMGFIQTWVPPWVPILGPLVSRMHVIVICSELQMQLEAGIPLVNAVHALSRSVPHRWMRRDLIEAHRRLRNGEPASAALESLGMLPAMGHSLLAAGDSCGQLPEMLGMLVRDTTQHLMEQVKRVSIVLRNALLLAAGVLVGLLGVSSVLLLRDQFEILAETGGALRAMRQIESYTLRPLCDFLANDLFRVFQR